MQLRLDALRRTTCLDIATSILPSVIPDLRFTDRSRRVRIFTRPILSVGRQIGQPSLGSTGLWPYKFSKSTTVKQYSSHIFVHTGVDVGRIPFCMIDKCVRWICDKGRSCRWGAGLVHLKGGVGIRRCLRRSRLRVRGRLWWHVASPPPPPPPTPDAGNDEDDGQWNKYRW